jgi:molybdopterin converting factor small subunit
MRVQVLFFGGLREILSCHQTVAECAGESATLTSVRLLLEQRFPGLVAFRSNTRLALNEEFLAHDDLVSTELKDGDVLAYIPPVTGG